MPNNKTRNTIARQWELLKALPARGEGKTVLELLQHLQQNGYDIQRRQVERDLEDLSTGFPLNHDDRNHGRRWRWIEHARCSLFGMSRVEALNWQLVGKLLERLLPKTLLQELDPYFQESARILDAQPLKGANISWHDKVRIVQPALPLLPPPITPDVMDSLQKALLEDRSLTITHKHPDHSLAKTLTLFPFGLVQRGPVSYLVAQAEGYSDVRLYAVHRISQATLRDEPVMRPEGFTLDSYIDQGVLLTSPVQTLSLVLQADIKMANILRETPMAEDQVIETQSDTTALIRVTVQHTWQLEWWLLSMAGQIVVQEPLALRERIRELHRQGLEAYT
jgi:predicted DNA-binding transcriptional regulator YafY